MGGFLYVLSAVLLLASYGLGKTVSGAAPAVARPWEGARFVADRKLPLRKLLTRRFRLGEAVAAYRLIHTQTAGKGVFVPD